MCQDTLSNAICFQQENGFQYLPSGKLPGNALKGCMALPDGGETALYMGGIFTAGVLARLDFETWTWTHLARPPLAPNEPMCGIMKNWNASTGEEEEFFVMAGYYHGTTYIYSIKVTFLFAFILVKLRKIGFYIH